MGGLQCVCGLAALSVFYSLMYQSGVVENPERIRLPADAAVLILISFLISLISYLTMKFIATRKIQTANNPDNPILEMKSRASILPYMFIFLILGTTWYSTFHGHDLIKSISQAIGVNMSKLAPALIAYIYVAVFYLSIRLKNTMNEWSWRSFSLWLLTIAFVFSFWSELHEALLRLEVNHELSIGLTQLEAIDQIRFVILQCFDEIALFFLIWGAGKESEFLGSQHTIYIE